MTSLFRSCARPLLLSVGLLLAPPSSAQEAAGLPVRTIGVVIDGPWAGNQAVRALFHREILELSSQDFDLRFPPEKDIEADWTAAGVRAAVDSLLADDEVDVLLAMGVLASADVFRRGGLDKPVIAPWVVQPGLQGAPMSAGKSGIRNLAYVAAPRTIDRDLLAFAEVVELRRLTILMNQGVVDALPDLAGSFARAAAELGCESTLVAVGPDVTPALEALGRDSEAVYVGSMLQLSPTDFQRLVDRLIELRLPSFALMGVVDVRQGLLMGLRPDSDFSILARRTGLLVQRILYGEAPENLPVSISQGERLTINMRTARAIGVWPTFEVLAEADLIDDAPPVARRLSLARAMQEALVSNLDLAAIERFVTAGAEDVDLARAGLRPQLELSSSGILIDDDRAAASFGSAAERRWLGGLTVRQLLWSEPSRARIEVERELQGARELERTRLSLDVLRDAGFAYLDVLRAMSLERIQREDLLLTRENLDLARIREQVGYSRPSETVRWENRIATARSDVVAAQARVELARIELNRVLHRPLEEPFELEEAGLDDQVFKADPERLRPYIDNPHSFGILRDFEVEEGLQISPELAQLDASIRAAERSLRSTKAAFWSPLVAVEGSLSQRLAEGGAGSGSSSLPFGSAPDDTEWSLALVASFDLYAGGAKRASRRQAREDLIRLRIEREAARERVEQRIRSAMHLTGASWANIRLSEAAADAARRNYELVADAYTNGVASIVDLLDAQNAALVSEQVAANAGYDFLIDVLEVQRSVGRFDLFLSQDQSEDWYRRVDRYFRTQSARSGQERER